ncbi:hypothetical protein CBR_g8082 [Chara braunii]|uniref:DUF659 domain-containing protein n=1 Tax=Chara braunii TaxID=69332 RepID=A0A388KL57_CHABU|nr:hypothetical protein CBR_g8082 [Chara braunii]|eukprot:GBG70784.1 hypothetical protein CBR_g8082 [Chara braunii]
MTSYVVDELQKEFDQGVSSFFFENAIAFNAARLDSYKNLERIMNLAARSRKILRMPGYNYLRTKALPAEYKVVDNDLDNIREPWDVTGLTLMTDGTTTTSNRPVMNFIAAGDSGAVMVKSVDMEGKGKSAPTLARMWEEIIRELGVHRVNAICTDSAQVNIAARKILAEHEDPAISSIQWVPCACHVCNLLMSDLASMSWVGEVILQGREITTFIKRHQWALAMFRKSGREYRTRMNIKEGRPMELIQPGETRFGTNFLMLQRLREYEGVLLHTVSNPRWADSPWDGTAVTRAWSCKELIRDPAWWLTVERACTLLEPVFTLMKNMDRNGRRGMQFTRRIQRSTKSVGTPLRVSITWIRSGSGKNSEEALTGGHVSMAKWWLTYGKRHPALTKIVVKVLSMWTTASPCERNWSTFDLIHSKRRNLLSPENLEMLVFIHRNKKLLRMSKAKMGFVNTEQLEWETPEDDAPFDGFMRQGEYDPAKVKRRAANWSKSRGRRSKSTRFDVREIQEERADDGAWLLDLSYRPRRLADDDRGKSTAAVDEEEDDKDDSDGDDEVLEVHLTDKRFGRRSGGGSCSTTHVDITPLAGPASGGPSAVATVSLMDDTSARTRLRSCAAGGVASVHGTSTVLGAQHTPHRRPAVEEPATGRGATDGGSANVDEDNAAAGDVRNFGVSTDVPVPGAVEREDGDIGADKDHHC